MTEYQTNKGGTAPLDNPTTGGEQMNDSGESSNLEFVQLVDSQNRPFVVPRDFTKFSEDLTQRVKILQEALDRMDNANSSRPDDNTRRTRVGFHDTITTHYDDNFLPGSTPNFSRAHGVAETLPSHVPHDDGWEGGRQQRPNRKQTPSAASHSHFTAFNSTCPTFIVRDIGDRKKVEHAILG